MAIAQSYRLPQTCANDQVATWSGTSWECAARGTLTAVNPGPGLVGQASDGTATVGLDLAFTDDRYQARYQRTRVVSPVGADPLANGTALLSVVDAIRNSTSVIEPWLIRVEPGTYDVGTLRVELPPDVVLEGAGPSHTIIRGSGSRVIAALWPGRTEIRSLRVELSSTNSLGEVTAISADEQDLRLVRVDISASGVGQVWGVKSRRIRYRGPAPDLALESCRIEVQGIAHGVSGGVVSIKGSEILVGGVGPSLGVRAFDDLEIEGTKISASAGPNTNAVAMAFEVSEAVARIRSTELIAKGSVDAVGASLRCGRLLLTLSSVTFDGARIESTGAAIESQDCPVRVGASMVQGSVLLESRGSITCAFAYDSSYQPLDAGCL
ncbi:hypothetical protein [Vulgatibacter incomptus]|uniref:hypothetical protein n=1 Tax=Vulgatibacter incomptus TaxID=1391653 RepID=UPI0012FB4EB8|nr:hypothetical protein [Vulgatibacter incomptus]